jgi:hypothetical protein
MCARYSYYPINDFRDLKNIMRQTLDHSSVGARGGGGVEWLQLEGAQCAAAPRRGWGGGVGGVRGRGRPASAGGMRLPPAACRPRARSCQLHG